MKKSKFSGLFTPQLVLQMLTLLVSAAVGWGVLKAQVNDLQSRVELIDKSGSVALRSETSQIQERLEELRRQNAVIEQEIRGVREILDLKTSPDYLKHQRP